MATNKVRDSPALVELGRLLVKTTIPIVMNEAGWAEDQLFNAFMHHLRSHKYNLHLQIAPGSREMYAEIGRKGAAARMKKLSPERRREIAMIGVEARKLKKIRNAIAESFRT